MKPLLSQRGVVMKTDFLKLDKEKNKAQGATFILLHGSPS